MNLGREKLDWSQDIWNTSNKAVLVDCLQILVTQNNRIYSQSEQHS